nr:hypothetical protein [Tanacetum cinerariifolium]
MPELVEDATVEAIRIRAKWENDDYIGRGHILNGMSDSLFDVYTNVESAKELWDSLESKPVMEQYNELLTILGQYTQHGLKMDESISVSSIIDKLPPSWKDFKHTLKHGKDDLSLVLLGSHLRIEESLKAQDSDKGKGKEVAGPSVNMTEEVVRVPTRNLSWNVGSVVRLVTSRGIAVVVIRRTQMLVVWEKGLRTIPKTKVDAIAWLIEFGATTHVCKDRCWFKTFEPVEDGYVLYMGDEYFAPVHGKGRIIHETTAPYTPQQNDVAKRKNKAGLSEGFRREAMLTACYLLNTVPNKRNKTTPYELWYKKRPNLSFLRVWGCRTVVRLPDPKRKTLGEKGIDCIFVGYAEHSKAYRFYVIEPNDSISINSIIESIDAIFDENRFSSIPRPKDIIPNVQESQMDGHTDDVPMRFLSLEKKEAVDDEIGSIMENNTWVLSDLPHGCKPLGFRQKERVDYFDTYAPVACITTIRLLLALAAIHNLVIHQIDVKTTFLNGDLDEKVYMKQPEGFVMPANEHKVCKLVKSLYGLKQAPNVEPVDQLEYSRAIGCLMYDMTSTRPDIAYVVGRLSRFTSNPNRQHWKAITREFKYLRGTKDYGLSYVGYPSVLEGYSDASWINHVEDSSSTSGWVFLLGEGAISWASKKQTYITSSTMESEFVALVAAGKEAEWLRNLIHEIPMAKTNSTNIYPM